VNCLFWNTEGKDLTNHLARIIWKHNVDLLVLAEGHGIDVGPFLTKVNEQLGTNLRFHNVTGQDRIRVFSNLPSKSVRKRLDSGGVAIRHIRPPLTDDFILVALHLPSKMHWQPNEQQDYCSRVRSLIDETESRIGHKRTIIVSSRRC